MRYYILLLVLFSNFVFSQDQKKIDSLAELSRNKADYVLENVLGIKDKEVIVLSTSNMSFLVIQKNDVNKFNQFYVFIDSKGNVHEKFETRIKKKYLKLLNQSFNPKNYKAGYIKKMDNVKFESGTHSYFVMKDKLGNRYGEYNLSVLMNPAPLDRELYGYLLNTLFSSKKNKIKG